MVRSREWRAKGAKRPKIIFQRYALRILFSSAPSGGRSTSGALQPGVDVAWCLWLPPDWGGEG